MKTIRIKGLKRTGLHMGYYTFESSKGLNLYVHYFINGDHGVIAKRDGSNKREFKGIAELKKLIPLYIEAIPLKTPKCNQCDSTTVNGVYCHESGCPNQDKKYNHESESWESVYTCAECGSEYDSAESAGECCQTLEIEEEETPLYDVFIRSWYTRDESTGKLLNYPGDKNYIAYGVTFSTARIICSEYNESHDPGELSIKAEFESQ